MNKPNSFRANQYVEWDWSSGTASGQVEERFEREVKGSEITCTGSETNPAYLIKQEDGDAVLKLGSELKAES